MINIKDLTIGQLDELRALLGGLNATGAEISKDVPFTVGDALLTRTVTFSHIGRVTRITADFLVFDDGGWVADTGRFSEALAHGTLNEFERAPGVFFVARGGLVDVWPWLHPLPKETK
jgi:hypothetical protein